MKHRILISILFLVFLLASACNTQPRRLQSLTSDQGVEIREQGTRILFFQAKAKSLDGKYERAGYVHPLYSLEGNVITEDFPEDHPHHHGIYSAWHQILLNGKRAGDGWTSENISWEVTDTKITDENDRIVLTNDIQWKASGEPIVKEHLTITAHESREQSRVIDYDFELIPLKDSVSIGGSEDEKGYGGFSFRLKLPDDIRFISSDGEVEPKVVSIDAGPWMSCWGSFDGNGAQKSGVLVLSHLSNPGHPQPWILRREKSMQNAVFPGRVPVALQEKGLSFRYRIVIHRDQFNQEDIAELYDAYTQL